MNSIKIALLSLLLSLSFSSFAQSSQAESSREVEEKINTKRIAYISSILKLNTEEAQMFWPLHNEYRDKLKALKQEHKASKESDSSSPDRLLDTVLDLEQRQLNARKDFAKKVQNLLGAERTLKLIKAERGFKEQLIKGLNDRKRKRTQRSNR